jgi:hypothetical protein
MRSLGPVTRLVFWVILACLLTSCMTRYPERFATVEEAYPSPQAYRMTPDVPQDSYKKVVFNAPYADVFRAVEVAVTMVGQNIESSDKSKGLILATRVDRRQWAHLNRPTEGYLFYAITVKELNSRTTEVAVFAKVQISCINRETVLGLGCEKLTTLHWATKGDADMQGLSQLINFTRNNLIQAGAL